MREGCPSFPPFSSEFFLWTGVMNGRSIGDLIGPNNPPGFFNNTVLWFITLSLRETLNKFFFENRLGKKNGF